MLAIYLYPTDWALFEDFVSTLPYCIYTNFCRLSAIYVEPYVLPSMCKRTSSPGCDCNVGSQLSEHSGNGFAQSAASTSHQSQNSLKLGSACECSLLKEPNHGLSSNSTAEMHEVNPADRSGTYMVRSIALALQYMCTSGWLSVWECGEDFTRRPNEFTCQYVDCCVGWRSDTPFTCPNETKNPFHECVISR